MLRVSKRLKSGRLLDYSNVLHVNPSTGDIILRSPQNTERSIQHKLLRIRMPVRQTLTFRFF